MIGLVLVENALLLPLIPSDSGASDVRGNGN